MSGLIFGSNIIHEAMHVGLWFLFIGLAVTAHTAQSEEGSFSFKKDISTFSLVNPDTQWQPSYRINTNVALNRSKDASPIGAGASSTPRLLLVAEPKKEDDWSINIQKQIPSSNNCSPLSSLLCFDSKEERPDIKPLRDSFWVVWRKALHF